MRNFLSTVVPDADRRTAVICISAAALLTVYLYQGYPAFYDARFGADPWLRWTWQFASSFVLLAAAPALIVKLGLRAPLAAYGWTLGDWRWGLRALGAGMLLFAPILVLNARDPEFRAIYPFSGLAGKSVHHFALWELQHLVFYLGWEAFFRGFLQLGLAPRIGAFAAMMMQMLPSTIAHPGKPEAEMLGAILGGVIFGAMALRSRSFVWPLLLHWYLGVMTDLFCLLPPVF